MALLWGDERLRVFRKKYDSKILEKKNGSNKNEGTPYVRSVIDFYLPPKASGTEQI